MKKIISFIVMATLILSQFALVYADDGDTVARLILTVKEKFSIDDEKFVFENYNKEDYSGSVSYYLSWKGRNSSEYSDPDYISARISEDGEVEYYHTNQRYAQNTALPMFSREEIRAKAMEYVKRISPERAVKLGEAVIHSDTNPSVEFERVENGIPVAGDSIRVELSSDDLALTSYNCHWTDTEFPAPEKILTPEEAQEAYKEQIGYELLYNIKTKNYAIEDIYLSLSPKDASAAIDAFSGMAVKPHGVTYKYASGATNDMAVTEETSAELSREEQQLVDEVNEMITKEDAEKTIRQVAELSIPADAVAESFAVSRNKYGEYIARIQLGKNNGDYYYNAWASINAKTKEIISFNQYSKITVDKAVYPADKAKTRAEAFLQKYCGDNFSRTQPQFVIGASDEYSFNYDRYENGIRVSGDGLRISFNPHTGEIENFNCTWADTTFPSKDNAKSLDYAYEKIFAEGNFRLQYVTSAEYIYNEKSQHESVHYTANLLYAPAETPIYHAQSGRQIDGRGVEITEKFKGYSDLNGHYSETAATELARMNIYFEGGKLEADREVSQKEFLKFVCIAVQNRYFSNYDDMYRRFIREGLIAEEDMGKPLTRIEAIRIMTDAMGFKQAAQIPGIYNCPFKDVDEAYTGYAAIAGGLGIISTATDVFRSTDIMTRGEAITVIYNYLAGNK